VAVGLAVAVLELIGPTVNGMTAAQVLLLVLLLGARFFGTGPAILASFCAAAGFFRYFVTEHGYAYGDPNDWAAFVAFVVIAVVGGELASRAERRAAEAQAGRQEIARLYQELEAAFERASEAEAARRSEQLKAALLDAITHNLRTPLTAIKAAVTALIGAGGWHGAALTDEGRAELLQIIDEESDRLNRLIDGLSSVDRRAAAVAPILGDVRLLSLVHAAAARAENLTREHRVVIEVKEPLPMLAVDAASVTEVLYMLLDNASKYAPTGTTIRVGGAVEDEHFLRVTVADEGRGVAPELRERVFDNFYRVPAREPSDPNRRGIGLGLPIARRLVDAQGGQIWIEAPPGGRGTLVVMRLPRAAEAAAAPAASAVA
jgi:two-component system sensor histidine kinase KdpD